MSVYQISFFLISIILISIGNQKELNTFSNYDIIKQKKVDVHFTVNFDKKIVDGKETIFFEALDDGEVIILDTKSLEIRNIKVGEEKLNYQLDTYSKLESHGVPLKIYKEFTKGDEFNITITYSTKPESMAIDWLDKEQTSGKKHPFMYTQCQAVLCRELLPIQDTPAVKMPVTISITVPNDLLGLAAGILVETTNDGNDKTYTYETPLPIPSYLIAIAAGDISSKNVSERCTIYAESAKIEEASEEFNETEKFLKYAEEYIGPYEWKQYNILVLPPSFPFGGMENPTLTFLTPSIIAGDKSLVSVVAHEISHSWTGNLVTNENWPDFWLNEGFTVFLERKILARHKNEDMAKLHAMIGLSDLKADIIAFGESKSFTSLQPDLLGRNPDDSFNKVPYEKGFNFLYYLEQLVNKNNFQGFMKSYIADFKNGVVKYLDFKNKFISYMTGKVKQETLDGIEWDKWVYAPGFPPVENNFTNIYAKEVDEKVKLFYEDKLDKDFVTTFKGWFTLLKQNFLNKIKDTDVELSSSQLNYLTDNLGLNSGYNVEVSCSYFLAVLYHGRDLEKFKDALIKFLGEHGRINYIRPLFSALAKRDKKLAKETLDKYRKFYHSIVIKYVELDMKAL